MSGLKELKRRQKTAMVIERMTGAMKMISRARYTASQNEKRHQRDLIQVLQHMVKRIATQLDSEDQRAVSVLANQGSQQAPWLFVVMTSDSGLCGGFNQKIIKAALQWLGQHKNESVEVLCVGKKGAGALQKRPDVTFFTPEDPSEPHPSGKGVHARDALSEMCDLFKSGKIRGCSMVYGKFFNILKQEPEIIQILPSLLLQSGLDNIATGLKSSGASVKPGDERSAFEHGGDMEVEKPSHPGSGPALTGGSSFLLIEPNGDRVLDGLLDICIRTTIKNIVQEHTLSEHAARMNAMDSANSNAKDMIRRLKIQYNRLRQDRITKEIIEIISGSDLSA